MASIVVSDYTTIVNKLETLRAKVSAAWSTVTTYGSGAKPSVSASNTITAKQVNTLVEAYFDFKEKWIGSATCSATYGNCTTYGSACNITGTCSATLGNCTAHGTTCSATDSCSATLGNCAAHGTTCSATDSCSATLGSCTTYGSTCSATDSCSATLGNCTAYGSACSVTLECSANCSHSNCSSTCPTHTCGSNTSNTTVYSGNNGTYRTGSGSSYSGRCESVCNGVGS